MRSESCSREGLLELTGRAGHWASESVGDVVCYVVRKQVNGGGRNGNNNLGL